MIAETYTANNRDGQTWLVCPGKPDILLTDYLPDGTKVRGDEIDLKWQWFGAMTKKWYDEIYDLSHAHSVFIGADTRQVATLKQKREVVDDEPIDHHFQSGDHPDPDIASEMIFHCLENGSLMVETFGYGSWLNGNPEYRMYNFTAEQKQRLIKLLTTTPSPQKLDKQN